MREPQVAGRGRLVCFSEYERIMLDLHELLLAAEF
jgi:hypothetical protein